MDQKKSQITRRLAAVLSAVFLSASGTLALAAQEKADLEWRTLAFPGQPDDHPSVYWEYIGGDPANLDNHLVIEMLGQNNGIVSNTLNTFENASSYYGAYTIPYHQLRVFSNAFFGPNPPPCRSKPRQRLGPLPATLSGVIPPLRGRAKAESVGAAGLS